MSTIHELPRDIVRSAYYDMIWEGKPLVEIPMAGDGNCLFRAFAYSLRGMQNQWPEFRRQAAKHMDTTICLEWADGESPETIRNGGWGGPLSIEALARVYKMRVVVFGVLRDYKTLVGYIAGADTDPIFFLRFTSCHFNCAMFEEDYNQYFQDMNQSQPPPDLSSAGYGIGYTCIGAPKAKHRSPRDDHV